MSTVPQTRVPTEGIDFGLVLFCPETFLFPSLCISFPAILAQSTVLFCWGVLWRLQESLARNCYSCWEAIYKKTCEVGYVEYHLQDTAACVAFADAGEKCVCVCCVCVCVRLHLQRLGIWQKFLKFNTFFW